MTTDASRILTETIQSQYNNIRLVWAPPIKVWSLKADWSDLETLEFSYCVVERRNGREKYANHACNYHDVRIIWPTGWIRS